MLTKAVREVFDLRPHFILKRLDQRRPICKPTTNCGHFGREQPEFTMEKTDAAAGLRAACKVWPQIHRPTPAGPGERISRPRFPSLPACAT